MAAAQDNKITELDISAALTGTEIVPVVQSSETRRTTLAIIKSFVTNTFAAVLAVGNKTGGLSITSDNTKAQSSILDASLNNRFVDGTSSSQSILTALTNSNTFTNGVQSAQVTMDAAQVKIDHTIKNSFIAPTNDFTGNIKMVASGNGIHIKTGTNATSGTAVLVAGVATISNTLVTVNSIIILTPQIIGTISLPRAVGVTSRIAGTSFTIKSADATDTSTIGWLIVEAII